MVTSSRNALLGDKTSQKQKRPAECVYVHADDSLLREPSKTHRHKSTVRKSQFNSHFPHVFLLLLYQQLPDAKCKIIYAEPNALKSSLYISIYSFPVCPYSRKFWYLVFLRRKQLLYCNLLHIYCMLKGFTYTLNTLFETL